MDAAKGQEREESEPILSEQVKAIDEHLDKLDRADAIKSDRISLSGAASSKIGFRPGGAVRMVLFGGAGHF